MIRRFVAFTLTLLLSSLVVFSCNKEPKKKKVSDPSVPETYFNNPAIDRDWPDPTIWESDGKYYSVATGIGNLLSSDDLVNWTSGPSPVTDGARDEMRKVGKNFWAPDVVKIGEKWMMYVTCYNALEDCGIVALSSDAPEGPFNYVGVITHSKQNGIYDSIDPEVVIDPESGKVWLFFGSTDKVYRARMNSEGTSLTENAEFTHVAGCTVSQSPSRTQVFEGTYLHYHDGYWYMFVSSGNYWDESYMIKVGRSASLEGIFVDKDGNRMTDGKASIVLSSEKGDNFYGPGHNGEILTDATGQDYIFYHCHSRSLENQNIRRTHLERIYWEKNGWPYFKQGKPRVEEVAPKLQEITLQ